MRQRIAQPVLTEQALILWEQSTIRKSKQSYLSVSLPDMGS